MVFSISFLSFKFKKCKDVLFIYILLASDVPYFVFFLNWKLIKFFITIKVAFGLG